MLQAGAPLGLALKGRIGLEVRLIVMGGSRILQKLHESRGDMFHHRPVLGPTDWLHMLRGALWPRKKRSPAGGTCSHHSGSNR
jgi:hypothetical protein